MASSDKSGSFGSGMSDMWSDSSGAQTPQARAAAESVRSRSPAQGARTRLPAESARSEVAAGRTFESDVEGPGLNPSFQTYLDLIHGRTDKMIAPRHETLMSQFMKHKDTLKKYMDTKDLVLLKTFIQQNFGKIVWLDYLENKLKELVEAFATADQKRLVLKYDYNAESMIRVLRDLLESYQRKFAVLDLSAEFPDTAEGLEIVVEKTRRKMSKVIEELQSTIRNQQDEMAIMKDNLLQMAELRAELEAERNHVKYLYERDKYAVADPSSQEQFMQDLQYQLTMQEQLGSSLREELEQERRSKEEILEQYLQVETKRIQEHQEKMREIAEATRHLEMKEVIQQAIIERIQTLTPNPAEVKKSVDEWIKATQQVLAENEKEVYSLTMRYREVQRTVTSLELDIEERKNEIPVATAELEKTNTILREMNALIEERKNEIADAKAKLDRVIRDLRDLTHVYRIKEEEYLTREEDIREISEELEKAAAYYESLKEEMERVPDRISKLSRGQSIRASQTIPEQKKIEGRMTPEGKIAPKKGKMTPSVRRMTPIQYERLTPRMKERSLTREVRERARRAPLSPIEEEIAEIQPGVSSFAAPVPSRTPPLSPSQRISQELQIPAITITPPPASRTIEASVSPSVATPHSESPFASKSPFEYRDPAEQVRELNLPLSPYEVTPFRQTVVLPSPKKEEPLVVNIAVDPKPIIETTNGECFVCDISLDVQPGGHSMFPQLPQIGEAISPHRLDRTPDRVSEMSETVVISPSTESDKSPSPIIKGPTRPISRGYFSDEIDTSPSPVIKGSTQKHLSFEYDTSPSPIIKGLAPRFLSDESDEMSPVIRGRIWRYDVPPEVTPTSTRRYGLFTPRGIFKKGYYNIRKVPGSDPISEPPWSPTYLPEDAKSPASPSSPPPIVWSDRTMSWEQSPASYTESDKSPSPIIKGPTRGYLSDESDTSPSPVIKGPTRRYLSDESDTSPSPVIKGPTYRYRSSDSDSSSASPALRRSRYGDPYPAISSPLFDTPPSGYESELDRSRTPQSVRTYDDSSLSRTYQSPNRSFLNRRLQFDDEAEPDDTLNRRWQPDEMFHSYGISDNSSTSSRYQTFDNSFSSPQRSYQDPLNRQMQLSEMFESFPDRSFSPQMARTAGGYFSPDGTYGPDSTESEGGYTEGSLNDSSLLDESRYLN